MRRGEKKKHFTAGYNIQMFINVSSVCGKNIVKINTN
jgi:hypothetical protein